MGTLLPSGVVCLLCFTVVVRLRVDDLSPVESARLKRRHEYLSRRDVRRERNVVHVAHTEKVVLLLIEHDILRRVAEVDQKVYLVVRHARGYLAALLRALRRAGALS